MDSARGERWGAPWLRFGDFDARVSKGKLLNANPWIWGTAGNSGEVQTAKVAAVALFGNDILDALHGA